MCIKYEQHMYITESMKARNCETDLSVNQPNNQSISYVFVFVKGKSFPSQALSGPEGSRKLRFPHSRYRP